MYFLSKSIDNRRCRVKLLITPELCSNIHHVRGKFIRVLQSEFIYGDCLMEGTVEYLFLIWLNNFLKILMYMCLSRKKILFSKLLCQANEIRKCVILNKYIIKSKNFCLLKFVFNIEYRVNKRHATKSKHMIQSIDYFITHNLCLSQRNTTCGSILCIDKENIFNSEWIFCLFQRYLCIKYAFLLVKSTIYYKSWNT